MLHWLSIASFVLNFLALTLSLWVGLYLVTRSPQTDLTWLAALTLWFMALWFTYNALRVVHPIAGLPVWLGRFAMLSLALWYHLTLRLRDEVVGAPVGRPRWRQRLGIALLYGVSVLLAIDSARFLLLQAGQAGGRQLTGSFASELPLAPSYAIFVGIVIGAAASLCLQSLPRPPHDSVGLGQTPVYPPPPGDGHHPPGCALQRIWRVAAPGYPNPAGLYAVGRGDDLSGLLGS